MQKENLLEYTKVGWGDVLNGNNIATLMGWRVRYKNVKC